MLNGYQFKLYPTKEQAQILQELGEKAHGFIRGMNRCFCLLELIIRTDTIELWDKTIDVLKPRYP